MKWFMLSTCKYHEGQYNQFDLPQCRCGATRYQIFPTAVHRNQGLLLCAKPVQLTCSMFMSSSRMQVRNCEARGSSPT